MLNRLVYGLSVILLLTAAACTTTTPAAPTETTETARTEPVEVAVSPTSQPTITTAPTATPEPTATPPPTPLPPARSTLDEAAAYDPNSPGTRPIASREGEQMLALIDPVGAGHSQLQAILDGMVATFINITGDTAITLQLHVDPQGQAWTSLLRRPNGSPVIPIVEANGFRGPALDLMGYQALTGGEGQIVDYTELPSLNGEWTLVSKDGYVYAVVKDDNGDTIAHFDATQVNLNTGLMGEVRLAQRLLPDGAVKAVYQDDLWTAYDADDNTLLLTLNPETMEWEEAPELDFVGGFAVAEGKVYGEGENGPEVNEQIMEAMTRGGLEPLGVWQDPDTETIYFTVLYEGQELEAELKNRHVGIGRALIVRDVFVLGPNPDMPPPQSLSFENRPLPSTNKLAVIKNPQLVDIAKDWVVFINPPVDVAASGYWQARARFRGYYGGQLRTFTVHFRSVLATATGYTFDIGDIERDTRGTNPRIESGDIWREVRVTYPTSGADRADYIGFYQRRGDNGRFIVGRYRPIEGVNDGTFESFIQAVLDGYIDPDVYFSTIVALPVHKAYR
jgi:hypothetical protein